MESIYTEYKCPRCNKISMSIQKCRSCGKQLTSFDEYIDEDVEQIRLIQWTKRNTHLCGELWGLFAIANGGLRHIATASRLKLTGTKKGVPDLFLPVARHNKHGLFIEMKRSDKKVDLSTEQKHWAIFLRNQGYACVKANGFGEAKAILKKYLKF